jgi:HAD superfamily hydrolase (TIGR01509 family)
MTSLRAVAWDIDGTLIDSEPLHDAVLNEICFSYGATLTDIPPDHFRGVHMPDVWKALQHRHPKGLEEKEWYDAIIGRYVERAVELQPLPGALETMRALSAAGIRQVCVSNSGRRVVDANLAALAILDLIDFSISLDDVSAGKPEPEPYLLAASRLGIPTAEIAAVEDSVAGATSARAAGLRVFGLAAMEGGHIEPAHVTIHRLHDLPGLILPPQPVRAR